MGDGDSFFFGIGAQDRKQPDFANFLEYFRLMHALSPE